MLSTQSNAQAKRVLIAEDDKNSQLIMDLILSEAGLKTETAENGKECLDIALDAWDKNEPFDVILMDIQMPVLDGYQAAQELRKRGYDKPILAVSARITEADREQSLAAGCNAFVSKLAGKQSLVDAVSEQAQENKENQRTLPFVPDMVRASSTCRGVALELIERIPTSLTQIKEGIEKGYYWQIKTAACDLGSASFCGYKTLASYLTQTQVAAEAEDIEMLEKVAPFLEEACDAVVASKGLIEALEKAY